MTHLPPRKRMDLRDFWYAHLIAWQSGDMNQRAYCLAHNLPLKRFGNWRATLRDEMPPPPKRLLYRRSVTLSHMTEHVTNKETQHLSPGYLPPMVMPSVPPRTRCHYSPADKRNIVAETDRPGATVSGVARRYGISSRSLFRWKQTYTSRPEPIILPVTLVDPAEAELGSQGELR